MKKLVAFILLLAGVRANAQNWDQVFAQSKPMSEIIQTLLNEANDGFAARKGQKISEANDVVRYATAPIAGLNSASQYIAVQNGKAFYVVTFEGKKNYAYVDHAMFRLTNNFRDVQGPYNMRDDYIDVNNNAAKSLFHEDDALYGGTNDGWRTSTVRKQDESVIVARYRTRYAEKKVLLIIGPVADYRPELNDKLAKQDAAWREETRKAYKMTGFAEQDSIGLSHYSDINGDGGIGRAIEKLYELQANNDYDHTVGEEFKAGDGITRYRSPAWFNSDVAYYQKDTSGLGTMLYAYYQAGKANTLVVLQALHRLFSANNYDVFGTAGPHEFLSYNRDGSSIMYRFDTTATAAYKGLTIIVTQMWKLKEKQAQYEAFERNWEATMRARNNPGYTSTTKGDNSSLPCICCHGTGKVQVKSNSTYLVKDKYGNNIGTTNYVDQDCPCCHGTGKQL